ncbi:MAG: hypothetical protein M3094_00675, partial [Actinomycetia bacterium]|nr:hypothetical protein [Actinomycetes bacterium]
MRRLVDDDVRNRLRKTDRRGLVRRNRPFVRELTSRISSTNIPQILDQLGIRHVPEAGPDAEPIDVLLATNMISVGVDVPRLGLMVVAGQPKTTAEYIQATSRIGRDASAPGVVFTLYNWARPRDLSHYETFEQYHATFYRHVEALSVTPFAARALDRGLTAVLVAMARQGHPAWSANGAAQDVDTHDAYFDDVLDTVAERAAAVHSDASIDAEIRAQLQHRLDVWAQKQNKTAVVLGYKARQAATIPLLELPAGGPWTEWTCPNSLRETEAPVNFIIDPDDPSLEAAPAFRLGAGAKRDVPAVRTIEDDETDDE